MGFFSGFFKDFSFGRLVQARAQTDGEVFKLAFDASHEWAKLSVGQKRGTREFTGLTPKGCSKGGGRLHRRWRNCWTRCCGWSFTTELLSSNANTSGDESRPKDRMNPQSLSYQLW
jgi:hypothetical protein